MTDLHALLELATDEVEGPDLVRTSLATARRRRTWRRGGLASALAVIAVAGVLVVPQALDSSDPVREPAGTPGPTPSPSDEGVVAPPIEESVIQPAWDPSTVASLPRYSIGHIPTVLAPGDRSTSTPGDTEGVLALSRSEDDRLAVLYGERGWYGLDRVPGVGDIQDSSLSRDGTRMAVVGKGGLFWCAAAEECPEWTKVELPERAVDEDTKITWTDDPGRLIVAGFNTGYVVDLDSGMTTELPYLGHYTKFDVASDGTVVSQSIDPRAVLEWDGTTRLRTTETGDLDGLTDLAIHEGELAATRIDLRYESPRATNDGDGLVVLDRDGLATRAFLPLTGGWGEWVDAEQIKPVQWINEVTVLFSVVITPDDVGFALPERYLVAWNIETGDLGQVASSPADLDLSLRDLGPA